MADKKSPQVDNIHVKNGNFICGVVEGFYGRPWTTEQRKDLFQKFPTLLPNDDRFILNNLNKSVRMQ